MLLVRPRKVTQGCLQVQPQPAASSDFTDKADEAAIFDSNSGQHSHQCACLCLKEAMQLGTLHRRTPI